MIILNKFTKLFNPLKIRNHTIKNRIVSSAHGESMTTNGLINEQLIHYYERKAEGGTGLIIAFGSGTVYKKASPSNYVNLWNPVNDPYLRDIADRVHAYGAKIIAQATHKGRRGKSIDNKYPLQAPSAIPDDTNREIPHALSKEEIKKIIGAYVSVARRLEKCGFDGIEITSYGSHLIEQFWSPVINQRQDEYGGDLSGRMRFSVEVLKAVREAVSDKFMISFRMTGDPMTDELGLNDKDMLEIATILDRLNCIDFFDITGGSGANLTTQAGAIPSDFFQLGLYNHLAKRMKEHLSVPILVAGRITDPMQAEDILQKGSSDLVAMTRAIIADPDLPLHAMNGQVQQIRPCTGTNQGCIARVYKGYPISCVVNPSIEDNSLDSLAKTDYSKNIIIVGGGPAGLEAARVASKRGHNVVLFEEKKQLGGQMIPTLSHPNRPNYGNYLTWIIRQVEKQGVKVNLGVQCTAEKVLATKPDTVIIATGAKTIIPIDTHGLGATCVTDVEVLNNKENVKKQSKVFIYDAGGMRGAYLANLVAKLGAAKVELATSLFTVCDDLDDTNKPLMYKELAKNNVICTPNQLLKGRQDGHLILEDRWSKKERILNNVDLIIFAGFRVSSEEKIRQHLLKENAELQIYLAGDNIAPRGLQDAIAEGYRIGSKV